MLYSHKSLKAICALPFNGLHQLLLKHSWLPQTSWCTGDALKLY